MYKGTEWLVRADRSGDLISVMWDSPCTSRLAPRPAQLLYNGYRDFPRGKTAGVSCRPPTRFYSPCCEWLDL